MSDNIALVVLAVSRNGYPATDDSQASFETVVSIIADVCRLVTRHCHVSLILTADRQGSSSFEGKRWLTWCFTAQNFQYSTTLLLLFWASLEACLGDL